MVIYLEKQWSPQQDMGCQLYPQQQQPRAPYMGTRRPLYARHCHVSPNKAGSESDISWTSSSSIGTTASSTGPASPPHSPSSSVRVVRAGKKNKARRNVVRISDCYPGMPVGFHEQYVALDCEMVGVGVGGEESALARVTVIDWWGETMLDEFVQQDREVTDYRTFVSGITPEKLKSEARLDLSGIRQIVLDLLRGKVLVGHGLKNDLNALGIMHPWYMIRDTAWYEPYMKIRPQDGCLWPSSLRELAKQMLNRDVQVPGKPHCSYEDALAALDLYRLSRVKWERTMHELLLRTRAMEVYYQRFGITMYEAHRAREEARSSMDCGLQQGW